MMFTSWSELVSRLGNLRYADVLFATLFFVEHKCQLGCVIQVPPAERQIDLGAQRGSIGFAQPRQGFEPVEREIGRINEIFAEMHLAFFADEIPGRIKITK